MRDASETKSPEVRYFLRALWRRRWPLLAVLILLPVATYVGSSRLKKTYQASTLLQVVGGGTDQTTVSPDTPPTPTSVDIASRLIQTSGVAKDAAGLLHPVPAAPRSLLKKISVTPDQASGFITLTANGNNGAEAAALANAFADSVVSEQTRTAQAKLGTAINQLNAEVNATTDPVARRQLSSNLQRLRALRAVQSSNINVVEPAVAPSSPVSPRPGRNTLLALFVALLLAAALAAILERLDSKVRTVEEIEEITGATMLAVLPRTAFRDGPPAPEVREAIQTLRTALTFFNVDSEVNCVLVTSALKEEGKTTVATRLAESAAHAGKNVILVDTDLRRPTVAKRMGITGSAGITSVLIGEASLFDCLVDHKLDEEWENQGRLRVLPCTAPALNPSELLASARMRWLLNGLKSIADLVIIDTSPLMAVSDAMPLVGQASGVIVCARLNQVRREPLRRMREVITSANGTIVGVVPTGAGREGVYGYGGYGYGGYEPTETPEGAKASGAPGRNGHSRFEGVEGGAEETAAPTGTPAAEGKESETSSDPVPSQRA